TANTDGDRREGVQETTAAYRRRVERLLGGVPTPRALRAALPGVRGIPLLSARAVPDVLVRRYGLGAFFGTGHSVHVYRDIPDPERRLPRCTALRVGVRGIGGGRAHADQHRWLYA